MFSIWHYIILLILALTCIPAISLTVRRLHDLNFSGWWIIPLYLSNLIYIGMIPYLLLFFVAGKDEENRFGESPYSIDE